MQEKAKQVIKRFIDSLDTKLGKFREKSESKPEPEKPVEPVGQRRLPAPATEAELLSILRRTPDSVLSSRRRRIIASAMTFSDTKVSDIMLEKPAITFVKETDFLGPLTLDRLYKSGFSHFPVVDSSGKIVGTISTENLNSLKIKEADRAFKYLDPKVFYVRADYSLEKAFAAFLRTNSYLFVVIDKKDELVGLLTADMLVSFLLGHTPHDKFDADSSRPAVLNRK